MTHAALPWRDRAELWLAGGLKRYFQWFARTAEPGVDTAAQEYLFGSRRPDERDGAHNARAIPPIVWAYWSGAAAPPLIARCFANWRQFNPHFSIRVLDDDSVRNYLGELPEALELSLIHI